VNTVKNVTIAPATWTGRDDRFYLIVTYSDGSVQHRCRAYHFLSCAAKARAMLNPRSYNFIVGREKVA